MTLLLRVRVLHEIIVVRHRGRRVDARCFSTRSHNKVAQKGSVYSTGRKFLASTYLLEMQQSHSDQRYPILGGDRTQMIELDARLWSDAAAREAARGCPYRYH